ncbi:MAG TPA: PAS domain S-box protein [Dehalococcoidia bacterium]|nr:PAS domain S-box protein [Dehalococcoidia bacterium]
MPPSFPNVSGQPTPTSWRSRSGLPDSDALKRALFDAVPQALLCVNGSGFILLANAAAEAFFGYPPEELVGRAIEDLLPGHLRDVRRAFRKAVAAPPHQPPLGQPFPAVARRRDGVEVPAAMTVTPQRTADGHRFVAVTVGNANDSEDARARLSESEERNRWIIDHSPDAYFFLVNNRIQTANQAAVRLLGASSPDDLVGRELMEFAHPDSREASQQRRAQVAGGQRVLPFEERKFLRLDGSTIEVEVAAIASVFQGKRATVLVMRDLTERKRAQELQVRARAAEESARLKTSLLSTVSHELRTPLAAIRGYASTMVEYFDHLQPAELKEYARGIDNAARHLEELVSDLLTVSRIEAGVLDLDPTEVRLGSFLRSIVRAHKLAKRAPDLRFTAPSDDPIVRADVVRLQQVIDNLIDNAVKYAGHAGPISVRLTSKSGAARVSVADKGPGVPGDALESMFLPFVRLKATPGAGGTGLGLAVAKASSRPTAAVFGRRTSAAAASASASPCRSPSRRPPRSLFANTPLLLRKPAGLGLTGCGAHRHSATAAGPRFMSRAVMRSSEAAEPNRKLRQN